MYLHINTVMFSESINIEKQEYRIFSETLVVLRAIILSPVLFPFRLLQNIEQSSYSRSLVVIHSKYSSVALSLPLA